MPLRPKPRRGHHLAKGEGDELGHFQFGGSTRCLVFRPGAIANFSLPALPQPENPGTARALQARDRRKDHLNSPRPHLLAPAIFEPPWSFPGYGPEPPVDIEARPPAPSASTMSSARVTDVGAS